MVTFGLVELGVIIGTLFSWQTGAPASDFFRLGGDLNGNAVVNLADLGILSAHFDTLNPLGDTDGDGDVDLVDIGVLSTNYESFV